MNRIARLTSRLATVDPRSFQIAFLGLLLLVVTFGNDFGLAPLSMAAILVTALVTQAGFVRALGLPDPGPLSPLISALSLCLLLRTSNPWVAALAAAVAIGSKFVLRVGRKHVFNPTNFGLVVAVLLTSQAWVSPGQWGSQVVTAFLFLALGLTVVRRIGRLDITFGYLVSHGAILLGRMWYLGERPEVLIHRLLDGSLLVFAFFMISDPRSTPDRRAGRILFAAAVAGLAAVLRFNYFVPAAPIWALVALSPLTPVLDALWRGPRFEWTRQGEPDARASHAAAA